MIERRSLRSRQPALAVRQLFLSVTRRYWPNAMLLADARGCIIASVEGRSFGGEGMVATRACERTERELAAVVQTTVAREVPTLPALPKARPQRLMVRVRRAALRVSHLLARVSRSLRRGSATLPAEPVHTRPFEVEGQRFLLVVLGEGTGGGPAAREAIAGVRRILMQMDAAAA